MKSKRSLENFFKNLWPATRRDHKKLLDEIRACRLLLQEQHHPRNTFLLALLSALKSKNPDDLPELSYDFERTCRDLALPSPVYQSEFCLCSVAVGDEYRKKIAGCLDTHRAYALKHKIDYYVLGKTPNSFHSPSQRHPSWAKLVLISRLLEQYRYCLYLDADCMITNEAIPPSEISSLGCAFPGADLFLTEEDLFFNAGVILAQKSPTVRPFLNLIWKNEKYLLTGAWEQDSLRDLVIEYSEFRKKIHITEPRRLQAFPPEYRKKYNTNEQYLWQPGDFAMHFCHANGRELHQLMTKYLGITSDCSDPSPVLVN